MLGCSSLPSQAGGPGLLHSQGLTTTLRPEWVALSLQSGSGQSWGWRRPSSELLRPVSSGAGGWVALGSLGRSEGRGGGNKVALDRLTVQLLTSAALPGRAWLPRLEPRHLT